MIYLDSSAIVKRYVAEAGSTFVQAAIHRDPYVATTILSAVEVRAAFAAADRAGRIAHHVTLVATFLRDWTAYITISIDAAIVASAGDLAEKHGLRGYDAVQLACALEAAGKTAGVPFGTFDRALSSAAAAEGLPLLF
jgi:uncharacterized protein